MGGAPVEKDKDKDKEKTSRAKVPERFITVRHLGQSRVVIASLTPCSNTQDYKEHHAGRGIHFIVTMSAENVNKAMETGLEQQFKLTSSLATSNMMCFDPDGAIKKYTSPEEILEDFYAVRFKHYQKRKVCHSSAGYISLVSDAEVQAFMVDELQTQVERLTNQARFVQMIIDKKLVVSARKKADIVAELRSKNFRPFPKIAKAKEAGETVEALEDDDEPAGSASDYDYLLGMPIWSLTQEKVRAISLCRCHVRIVNGRIVNRLTS